MGSGRHKEEQWEAKPFTHEPPGPGQRAVDFKTRKARASAFAANCYGEQGGSGPSSQVAPQFCTCFMTSL